MSWALCNYFLLSGRVNTRVELFLQRTFDETYHQVGFPGGASGKEHASSVSMPVQETYIGSILGWEDPLQEVMATHSSILFYLLINLLILI